MGTAIKRGDSRRLGLTSLPESKITKSKYHSRFSEKDIMKRITIVHILVCVVVAALSLSPAAVETPLPFFEDLKLKTLDIRFKIRGGRKPSGNVVIAGIEQVSIDTYGRWPWPRSVLAQLIVRLKEIGARTIVFDLLFPEPEESPVARAIASLSKSYTELNLLKDDFQSQIFFDEMQQAITQSDNDTLMAQAVEWSGNVILGMALESGKNTQPPSKERDKATTKARYQYDAAQAAGIPEGKKCLQRENLLLPIPSLAKGAAGMGYVNIFPDKDGLIRRAQSTVFSDNKPFMPMAVAAAGHFLGKAPIWNANGTLKVGEHKIEFDHLHKIHLDFYGLENTFPLFSIADIIEGRISPEELKDKVVIIGGIATGLGDIWPTPLSSEIPGVLIHATLLDNILQNRVLKLPDHPFLIYFFTIAAMAFLPLVFMPWLSPLFFTLTGTLLLAGYAGVIQYLFTVHQLIWPAVLPLGAGVSTLLTLLVCNFIIEAKQHRWIKKSFSQYLSPDVIEVLVKNPEQLSLGGEEKELTVMLIDIRSFTTLSEGLAPTELTQLLNLYLGEMTNVILDHGGTLDKYMGDAIMAFFGAPLHDEDHASKACRTAIRVCERLQKKRKEWVAQGLPFLKIGMGLNTGKMVVGNLGSERRFDYSIIGDHVNLASRLEGLSKVYGVKMIISKYTRNRIGPEFTCRELDVVQVKGKSKPVRIYELMEKDTFTAGSYSFVKTFEKGLACYRNRSFPKAMVHFEKTLSLKPGDKPSQLFIHRCRTLEGQTLSESWDGTWEFSHK